MVGKSFADVTALIAPTAEHVLEALDRGVDLMHFVGHSVADHTGEHLILGEGSTLSAIELAGARGAPAPVCVFSSCLIGLHRQTRTGQARGIAAALLDAGSPAVIASTVRLPDTVGHDFALAFHFAARSQSVAEAVRAARRNLAQRGFHPVTWACFVVFGRHDASLLATDEPLARRWPALLIRYAATRDSSIRAQLESALPVGPARSWITQHADALLDRARPPKGKASGATVDSVEGGLALEAIRDLSEAIYAGGNAAADLLRRALLICKVLQDSYLLVAIVETGIRCGVLQSEDRERRALVELAASRLGWLTRSVAALDSARRAIAETLHGWGRTITSHVQELAGVDDAVLLAADSGDRNAQKEMLWNLMNRAASYDAITSELPWRSWLYRALGADGHQAWADFCGAVQAAERRGTVSADEARVLGLLYQRFAGPGEIEPEHAESGRQIFADPDDRVAVEMLLLYDRITSQERPVEDDELGRGVATARAASADGLVAFLLLQQGNRAMEQGDLHTAFTVAQDVVALLSRAVAGDPVYDDRFNVAAAFLYSVAARSGDRRLVAQVRAAYGPQIDAYFAQAAGD